MERAAEIARIYGVMGALRFGEAAEECLRAIAGDIGPVPEAQFLSLLTMSEYYRGEFAAAIVAGERAAAVARQTDDPAALLFALPAQLLANGELPLEASGDDPEFGAVTFEEAMALTPSLAALSPELRLIAGHQLAEAAFVNGRFAEASAVLDLLEDVVGSSFTTAGNVNASAYFMLLRPARIAIFGGHVLEAMAIVEQVAALAVANDNVVGRTATTSMLAMLAGNSGDRAGARTLAATIPTLWPHPSGQIESAFYVVAAYGLAAAGDLQPAAELIRAGCPMPSLRTLQTADRALCFEILALAALDAGRIDEARGWGEQILPLALHPVASAIAARLIGQLELADGSPLTSAELAEISIARARISGNFRDELLGEVLRARSLALTGSRETAIDGLENVALAAERVGNTTIHRAAARELRRLGRRVPPSSFAGWSGLSDREKQIALLVADGHTNRIIARSLFLSERTVQAHVSRVLGALGIDSRTSVPARVKQLGGSASAEVAATLTPRQHETALLVASGASNQGIAAQLGISVKTVEKHIGEVFLRWGVSSRTGIARIVVALTEGADPAVDNDAAS